MRNLTPDLALGIQRRIDDLRTEEGWLVRVCAEELNALPLHSRQELHWVLRPDGAVLRLERQGVAYHAEPETEPWARFEALGRGAERYGYRDPNLEPLVPPPPEDGTPSLEQLNFALHRAIRHRSAEECRRLLEEGADPNAPGPNGEHPLFAAIGAAARAGGIMAGDVELLELLLEHGARADVRRANGETPLHACAEVRPGREDAARALLRHGADLDARSRDGQTPLMRARTGTRTSSSSSSSRGPTAAPPTTGARRSTKSSSRCATRCRTSE